MKAIAYKVFGDTSVLQNVDEPKPAIQDNQVLVKVKAVSINPLDWKIRKGEMKLMSGSSFPKHTGTEFAGIVEAVGPMVTNVKAGDDVFGAVKNNMKEGALAEYVAVNATLVWKKPAAINFVQAASIPTVGSAAAMALQKMGPIDVHSRILVNGAAGGFGMFLLQLLRDTGAEVTAVTGANAMTFAGKWGASRVLNYQKDDVLTLGATYDVVVDLSGKMSYAAATQIMKPHALFINPVPKPLDILLSPLKNVFRGKKHLPLLSTPADEYMNQLLAAVGNRLDIQVSHVFPFSQTKEAYDFAEKGGYTGKIAIEVA